MMEAMAAGLPVVSTSVGESSNLPSRDSTASGSSRRPSGVHCGDAASLENRELMLPWGMRLAHALKSFRVERMVPQLRAFVRIRARRLPPAVSLPAAKVSRSSDAATGAGAMRIVFVTAKLPHGADEAFFVPEVATGAHRAQVLIVPRSPVGPGFMARTLRKHVARTCIPAAF